MPPKHISPAETPAHMANKKAMVKKRKATTHTCAHSSSAFPAAPTLPAVPNSTSQPITHSSCRAVVHTEEEEAALHTNSEYVDMSNDATNGENEDTNGGSVDGGESDSDDEGGVDLVELPGDDESEEAKLGKYSRLAEKSGTYLMHAFRAPLEDLEIGRVRVFRTAPDH